MKEEKKIKKEKAEEKSKKSQGDCHCHEHDDCGCLHGQECTCGDDCECGEDCNCGEECDCGDNCGCHNHSDEECCDCGCEHQHFNQEEIVGQYLSMAQRLQADFDNYRKRVAEQLDFQKQEGIRSVIEVFLPCLDTFKEAKKSIGDEKVLSGINMIEDKINNALQTLKVEKIASVGQKYDHNLHEVISIFKDESKEDDVILNEFQAGYKLNGKVIRYSKVVVNKLS